VTGRPYAVCLDSAIVPFGSLRLGDARIEDARRAVAATCGPHPGEAALTRRSEFIAIPKPERMPSGCKPSRAGRT